jgi:hypothetical protein
VPCVAAFTASSTVCSEQSLERQAVSHPGTAVQTRSLTALLVRAALTLVLAALILAVLVLAALILAILAAALILATLALAVLVLATLAALAILVLATLAALAILVLATLALTPLVLAALTALTALATAAEVILGALLALLDLVAEAAACALVSDVPGALEAFVYLLGMLAGELLRLVLELGEIWHGLPPVPESCGCHRQLGTLSARVVIRIGCQVLCRAACCWPCDPEGGVILPHTVAGLTSAFHVGERTAA